MFIDHISIKKQALRVCAEIYCVQARAILSSAEDSKSSIHTYLERESCSDDKIIYVYILQLGKHILYR